MKTMTDSQSNPQPNWPKESLRIVRSGELDSNTPQTPGMTRAEAISRARVGAQKLWAGTVIVHPNAKTGPHHHGELETVIYIVRGRARFRWGSSLEFMDEAGPGDFVYVPPYVPHQELNARRDQPVEAVIVRSGQEPIVVNLDIPSPEDLPDLPGDDRPSSQPDDPFHSAPRKR
ncbi:MAG: cupin domain-containing protein [Terriglobales bacterium]